MERLYQAQIYEKRHQFFSIGVVVPFLFLWFNRELAPVGVSYSFAQELKQGDHLLRLRIGKLFLLGVSLDPVGVKLEERSCNLRFITVNQIEALHQQKL